MATAGRMLCLVAIVLFSLLSTGDAQLCSRLYISGLNSTTAFYPQLAGVYKRQQSFLSPWVHNYPLYRHEREDLFLYYNDSQSALVMGPLRTTGLLMARRALSTSQVDDYTLDSQFSFSDWKQWDPRQHKYLENRNRLYMRPQCVDETFGYCLSGNLYPSDLYETVVQVVGSGGNWREYVDFSRIYFRQLDSVFHNLRPVYEMVVNGNTTSDHRSNQRFLYYTNGKWRVGAKIGARSDRTEIILELEGTAMRVEYENETEWYWLDSSLFTRRPVRKRAFGRLQCRHRLPDGVDCSTAGVTACYNDGTCHTDSNGVPSCSCAAGYRGIQCEHSRSRCDSKQRPLHQVSSVFEGTAPHYEGSIMTVFCLSGDIQYGICENGSWQMTSKRRCPTPTTTTITMPTTSTRAWWTPYNDSSMTDMSKDSTGMIASVIVTIVCIQLGFPLICYCCIACCQTDEDQVDEEPAAEDVPKAKKDKRSTSLQRTCSGFFYLCWWAWLVFIIVYFVEYYYIPLDGSTAFSAVVVMAFVCLGVLYCCVFSESFCSREYNYLSELENEEVTSGEQVAEMKVAKPTITFVAECSHDETKTRTVYDSVGEHLETFRERVKGAVIEEPFLYADCFDDSANFSPPQTYVTRVNLELVVDFADDVSKRVYEEAYEAFKARNLTRDTFVLFSVKNNLPGFVNKLAVHDPDYPMPTWMSRSCFCLASCCCMTWPYRFMFNSSISSYSYRIVKKVLARPVAITSQPQPVGDFQFVPPVVSLEPNAPPLPPPSYSNHRRNDMDTVPIMPFDQMPSVPPPSYEEFAADPNLFRTPKHGMPELIPMTEMKS